MQKKLIEVSLPLKEINNAAAREKSIRHGHPSTLHLWWARRPLAVARAVLFASLVDDPSANPDKFPTDEAQEAERNRLFGIICELVTWENFNNPDTLERARNEILKHVDKIPTVFDPFAGGGTIPLAAQSLGLNAVAADLNPVAVMINKAMIEFPAQFKDKPPVNPNAHTFMANWYGAQGLADDINYYCNLLKRLAFEKIGNLYPKIFAPELNQDATVIAWLWARTVTCSNPACQKSMPLLNSFWLSKKKSREVYLEPTIDGDKIIWHVIHGNDCAREGTVNRNGAKCLFCGADVKLSHIREQGKAHKLGAQLIAIVAERLNKKGKVNGRIYLPPDDTHVDAANVPLPENFPDVEMNQDCPDLISGRGYGFTHWHQLFTNRQLTALTTFSDLIPVIRERVIDDGGTPEYANVIAAYAAFLIDKLAMYGNSFDLWDNTRDGVAHLFGRQAIPMVWYFAETNPFSHSTGCFDNMVDWIVKSVANLPAKNVGEVYRKDASKDSGFKDLVISTDPPYYDNIGYADLSDFFYVWLKHNLRGYFPKIFGLMQTPKNTELVAMPYRFEGNKKAAKTFFEEGMFQALKNIYQSARDDIPVTIYYAYKQKEEDAGEQVSSGWETMLNAIIRAGFQITATFPMRTELVTALKGEKNALASSIVIVCRKRQRDGAQCPRGRFIEFMKKNLSDAMIKLQAANIAPVDMAQAAIGPGISIYSQYEQVYLPGGEEVTVRDALKEINHVLDEFLNGNSDALDAATRFCVELFAQEGFKEINFGDADVLARAKNISTDELVRIGVIESSKGYVNLCGRDKLNLYDGNKNLIMDEVLRLAKNNCIWQWVQMLVKILERGGFEDCAEALLNYGGEMDTLKNLAYRLYNIADKKNTRSNVVETRWAAEARGYNDLVEAWGDILSRREQMRAAKEAAGTGQQVLEGL